MSEQGAAPSREGFRNAAILIVVGIFATTLAQPQVLGRIPLQNMLKNELHVGREASSAFFFWIGMPWYLKPIAGILTDAFPIFGSRRKVYIILSAIFAALAWFAFFFIPHAYGPLLWGCLALSVFQVVTSAAVGGYMVEVAQAVSGSGRLTAVRNFVGSVTTLITGPTAGFLASIAFAWTAGISGLVALSMAPAAFLLLAEQRRKVDAGEVLAAAGQQYRNVMGARVMWAAIGLMALFYIAPGFGTAVFYRQQNELHMTTQSQGFNGFLGSAAGIVAAVLYGWACRRFNLRNLLVVGAILGVLGGLGYLVYNSVFETRVVDSIGGFCGAFAELALMDLAVRATPAGSESVGFSLMMSIRNVAVFGSDWFGSALIDRWHTPFNTLVIISAAFTAAVIPFIFLLPRVLVWKTDEDIFLDPAQPKTAIQT